MMLMLMMVVMVMLVPTIGGRRVGRVETARALLALE